MLQGSTLRPTKLAFAGTLSKFIFRDRFRRRRILYSAWGRNCVDDGTKFSSLFGSKCSFISYVVLRTFDRDGGCLRDCGLCLSDSQCARASQGTIKRRRSNRATTKRMRGYILSNRFSNIRMARLARTNRCCIHQFPQSATSAPHPTAAGSPSIDRPARAPALCLRDTSPPAARTAQTY